jgi:hypothetical protein
MKPGFCGTLTVLLIAVGALSLAGCYTQLGTADAEGSDSYEDVERWEANDTSGSGETYEESRTRFVTTYDSYYPSVAVSFGFYPWWGWNSWYYDPWYWYGSAWYPYYGYPGGGYWYGGGYYPPYYAPYPYPYAYGGGTRTIGSTRGGASRHPSAYSGGGTGVRTSPTRTIDRTGGRPNSSLPGATMTPGRTPSRGTGTQVAPPRTSRRERDARGSVYREQQARRSTDAPSPGQSYDGGSPRRSGSGESRGYTPPASRPSPPSSSGGGHSGGGSHGGSSSGGGSGRGGGRR